MCAEDFHYRMVVLVTFGADMTSSVHIDHKKKDISILGKGSTQGLDGTTLTVEAESWINFTEQGKMFCLSQYYNERNIYLFVNGVKTYRFKAKDSKLVAYLLFLRNISKDFLVDNMKETGLNGYVYGFSVDV